MLRRCRGSLACAMLLLLQGCITRALWNEGNTAPPLETTVTPCLVHDVTAVQGDGDRIEVRFSIDPRASVPAHLRRYTPTAPGLLSLTPPTGEGDWRDLPGAGILQPSSFDLRVTRASYFTRPTATARLSFHGTLRRAQVGHVCGDSEVPEEALASEALSPETSEYWPRRALEAFAAQPWDDLLAETLPGPSLRAVPIAWLDQEQRITSAPWRMARGNAEQREQARAAFADGWLLARLDGEYGEVEWAKIPIALLLQGKDLQLARDGDSVRWTRTQIWQADVAAAPPVAAAEPFAVPIAGNEFPYRWMHEVDESTLALTALRVIATPVTAVLDFAIMTNPYLANALRETTAEEQPDRTGKQH